MLRKSLLLLTLCLGLAACESPEERGERYYQSALALLEEGDTERALLELRNVFDEDGYHIEARILYADLVLERGGVQEAYGQYLRVVEQDPNRLDIRFKLANLALENSNWPEVKRHADAALAIDPEEPRARAYQIMLAYRDAREARDDIAAGIQVAETEALLEAHPDVEVAQRLMIDWLSTGPEPERALPYIESVLETSPDSFGVYMIKLSILAEQGNAEEIEVVLREMYDRFPENEVVARRLIQWYISRNDLVAAEAFLRERAGGDGVNFEEHLAVVQFLRQTEGDAAADAELVRLSEANAGTDLGRRYTLSALGLRFDAARSEETAQALTQLIDEIEGTDLRNEARIALVRVRGSQGQREAAQALLEEVLQSDPTNVDALMLRAAWRIQNQAHGEAITDLRTALDQDPRNPDILILLAEAHQKLGNVALAEQRLARAVEVSGAAARETLMFAQFQLARGNLAAAELALTESMRVTGDLDVARLLGQVMLQEGNFDGLARLISQLNIRDDTEAQELASSLRAAMLFNQNRIEESISYLRSNLDEEGDADSNFETDVQILRVQMMSGRLDEARVQLQKLRGQYPDSLALQLLQGNILSLEGNDEAAIAVYRQILADNPDELIVIQRLYSALQDIGAQDQASELLVGALDDQPDARPLQMLRAIEYERRGEYENAIFIYEELYARNINDIAVANNLASVLAYYRDNEADVERAYQIALQLAGSNLPEFQDTLGYVQFRRGQLDDAILNLQAAARGLPGNPTIAFNLAMAYAADGRTDAARAELDRGFELAGDRTDIPQLGPARILARELEEAGPSEDL